MAPLETTGGNPTAAVLKPMQDPLFGQYLDTDGHLYMEPPVMKEWPVSKMAADSYSIFWSVSPVPRKT